jgi:hypothetical protein
MIIKLLGTEGFANTTQSSYANAALVRVYNPNVNTAFLITLASNSTVNVGTITIAPGETMFIEKSPAFLLSCNAATQQVLVTPVAFKGN